MSNQFKIKPELLTSRCNLEALNFENTEELEPLKGIIGQNRAVDALTFGLSVKKKGYNIYVAGLSGTGKSSYATSIAETFAKKKDRPCDWLYVHNFKKPDSPKALSIEAGQGEQFKKSIDVMIDKLKKEIPNVFETTEYKNKKNEIIKEFQQKNLDFLKELNEVANKYGFIFKETDKGLVTLPLKNGKPMSPQEYNNLSHKELEEIKDKSHQLTLETMPIFNRLRNIEEDLEDGFRELDKQEGTILVDYYINKLLTCYESKNEILEYLNNLREDIIENISQFKKHEDDIEPTMGKLFSANMSDKNFFVRYEVNLLVNNKELEFAPIISESNPTFYNLNGSIEYRNVMGILKTDFTQIKPGAIHMANGGYIILQAKDLLSQPFAWEALKRALKTEEINIENMSKQTGHTITSSLKPEPIPIDLKVIIIGDAYIYNLLYNLDEDFRKLFKIMADFDVEIDKNNENIMKMSKFIATHCKEVGLRHFDKTAVARVIEYSSRLAGHQDKISSLFNQIVEILYEADVWAEIDESAYVEKKHVEKAISERIYRNSKYEEKLNELFADETMLLDVSGRKIGQINGLAVMGTGQHSFGKPNRITVSTYKGKSGIISIERETKRSGSIHDKGVLTLSGYLGCKYAQKKPMSLSVSISFEQNYSMIDGDSASSTELYAILSSIANVPIKQNIAVTGSVNQKGEIQPVGGINEKIEGFYDVCKIKGFTGDQGVIIPKQNVKNLMLKEEVIQSVSKGEFEIYAIGHVDQGIEILTDMPAGEEVEGVYPEGTINNLIMKKLISLHDYSQGADKQEE